MSGRTISRRPRRGRLIGPAAIVGLSTHTEPQIDAALVQPVTYVAVGPIFGTSTKATGYDAGRSRSRALCGSEDPPRGGCEERT